jgi:hypothetical protein
LGIGKKPLVLPQVIISVPVHTTTWVPSLKAAGVEVFIERHVSVAGS